MGKKNKRKQRKTEKIAKRTVERFEAEGVDAAIRYVMATEQARLEKIAGLLPRKLATRLQYEIDSIRTRQNEKAPETEHAEALSSDATEKPWRPRDIIANDLLALRLEQAVWVGFAEAGLKTGATAEDIEAAYEFFLDAALPRPEMSRTYGPITAELENELKAHSEDLRREYRERLSELLNKNAEDQVASVARERRAKRASI
jgi:hypothetical protein